MSSAVAILVPTLHRPHLLGRLAASITQTTVNPRIVFVTELDDPETHEAVDAIGDCDLVRMGGTYSAKINTAARLVGEPLLFTAADDLIFRPEWFERAVDKMRGPVRVVGTNDLGNPRVIRGEHATHFLVRREYVEQGQIDGKPGLLHEGYRHCFVDDELIATARQRGVYAMAADSHVEHAHPDWGKAPDDAIYRIGRAAFRADRRLFMERTSRRWAR